MESEATRQNNNVRPPRISEIIPLGIDTTARAYDLSALTFAGAQWNSYGAQKHVYLTLRATGGNVFFHFNPASTTTISATAEIAAGGTLAYANSYCVPLLQNETMDVRIDLTVDRYLCVRTSSGTATLYLWASSQPTPA